MPSFPPSIHSFEKVSLLWQSVAERSFSVRSTFKCSEPRAFTCVTVTAVFFPSRRSVPTGHSPLPSPSPGPHARAACRLCPSVSRHSRAVSPPFGFRPCSGQVGSGVLKAPRGPLFPPQGPQPAPWTHWCSLEPQGLGCEARLPRRASVPGPSIGTFTTVTHPPSCRADAHLPMSAADCFHRLLSRFHRA